ncbi:MAG: hypothetical protein JWM80_1669 [Cyanobacteria bacterium RYN_339]|nr:hypothetical protein [Cyanobacteria bacterium RYN_339]
MSLAALLDRYAPDAPLEERRALLEAIAAHLPAPEFLWYEMAIQALHAEGDELKPLVLGLLAHAPRSWHQVLMTALTSPASEVQEAALAALFAQATLEPERQEAFRALGELPGWRLEALERWSDLIDQLAAPPPAIDPHLVEQLEARVMDLEEENLMLRDDRSRLGTAFEAEHARAERLVVELDDLKGRHEALHVELLAQVDRLHLEKDNQQHNHHLVIVGLQEDLTRTSLRHRRTLAAGLMAVVAMVVVGGPIGYSLLDKSAVMAMSPEEMVNRAPRPISTKSDQSYERIMAQLKDEAEALEGEGRNEQALAVWQAAVRVAPSDHEAVPAQQGAQHLLERMRGIKSTAKPAGQPVAKSEAQPVAKPAKKSAAKPLLAKPNVAKVPAAPMPLPKAPQFQAPATDLIPGSVRDKF